MQGVDTNSDGTIDNKILWQRFEGDFIVPPMLGCNRNTGVATLPQNRRMIRDEILFHVQVSYKYQPIFSTLPFRWLTLPTSFTRSAMFRARNKDFTTPTPDTRFPPKTNCSSASGL